MLWLRSLPAALACLLLGAHFLRAGQRPLVVVLVLVAGLAFVRRELARWLVAATLGAGVVIWLHTAWEVVQRRSLLGEPAGRAAAILVAVALLTLLSAWPLAPTGQRDGETTSPPID